MYNDPGALDPAQIASIFTEEPLGVGHHINSHHQMDTLPFNSQITSSGESSWNLNTFIKEESTIPFNSSSSGMKEEPSDPYLSSWDKGFLNSKKRKSDDAFIPSSSAPASTSSIPQLIPATSSPSRSPYQPMMGSHHHQSQQQQQQQQFQQQQHSIPMPFNSNPYSMGQQQTTTTRARSTTWPLTQHHQQYFPQQQQQMMGINMNQHQQQHNMNRPISQMVIASPAPPPPPSTRFDRPPVMQAMNPRPMLMHEQQQQSIESKGPYNNTLRGGSSMKCELSWEYLPDYIFDTGTVSIRSLLANVDTFDPHELNDLYFIVKFVNFADAKFVDMEMQQHDIEGIITFGVELYRKLPIPKLFVMWIQVYSYSTGIVLREIATPTIHLLHDGLKETPPQITADVCFFPQKVVISHIKNCNSKATLSKRHKKVKIKEGSTWCRNTRNCTAKGSCGCQAYPSRILKKGIREIKHLMEKNDAPPHVTQAAGDLYTILSQTADKQSEKIPHYESFLRERIKRWKLFVLIKDYAESPESPRDIREKFRFIWGLLPSTDMFVSPGSG